MKNNNSISLKLKGNITVEAAFVMPMILLTIFLLLYLSFILHDRCKIQGITDGVLHKVSLMAKEEAGLNSYVIDYEGIRDRGVFYPFFRNMLQENKKLENYLQEKLAEGLFLFQISKINAEIGTVQISAEVEAVSKIELPLFQDIVSRYSQITVFESIPIHNPAEALRYSEVILETGSKLKGFKELKNMLIGLMGSE